jgi:hypothetical protein
MSNIKISQLPSAGALSGSEILPIVQTGDTKSTTINSIVGEVTLQKVTDNDNTTTNNIVVDNGSGNTEIISGVITLTSDNTTAYAQIGSDSQSGILRLANLNHLGQIYATNLTDDRTYELPDASGTLALTSDIGAGYKVYSALGYYSSGTFTVTTELQNTLGATITWGNNGTLRTATGSSNVFTANKTVITATPIVASAVSYNNIGARSSDTVVTLSCYNNTTGTVSYPFSQNIFVEIRVYP